MAITDKLCGLICFASGFGILYLEYRVICVIGAVGSWIADLVGATGNAHAGIALIAYVPCIGLILLILLASGFVFKCGLDVWRS